MVVVVLASARRGAEQQEANPGLDEGEGGAVRVTGGHHHLRSDKASQRKQQPSINIRAQRMLLSSDRNHPLVLGTAPRDVLTSPTLLVAMKRVKARMSVLLDTGSQWVS